MWKLSHLFIKSITKVEILIFDIYVNNAFLLLREENGEDCVTVWLET